MRKLTVLLFAFVCFGMTMNAQINLGTGLVAYYPFSGNANDASGNGNNGTVFGAKLVVDRFGNSNGAYSFDGIDNYIRIPHHASLNITEKITLSCWVKYDKDPACYEDVMMKGSDSYGFQFSCSTSKSPMFHLTANGWRNLDSGIKPVIGKWHHLLGTYDGSSQKIYVDGVLIFTSNLTAPIQSNSSPLDIGYKVAGDNSFGSGTFDDIRIYNRALTEPEILALFNETNTSSQINLGIGLVAYYPFNGNANDASENANNGTVFGAKLVMDRLGNANGAYSFNGIDNYIRVPDHASLNITEKITLSCWVKYDKDPACYEDILMKGSDSYGFQFSCSTNKSPMFHLTANGWRNLDSGIKPVIGKWHHLLGTYDGSSQKIYVDGLLIFTSNLTAPIQSNSSPLDIGYKVAGDNSFGSGTFDDIRIYNRALNESEIQTLYNGNQTTSSKLMPEPNNRSTLLVYPNPARNTLVVEDISVKSTISIFDLNGKLILSKTATSQSESIDLSDFKSGVYTIRIVDGNVQKVSKFTRQ